MIEFNFLITLSVVNTEKGQIFQSSYCSSKNLTEKLIDSIIVITDQYKIWSKNHSKDPELIDFLKHEYILFFCFCCNTFDLIIKIRKLTVRDKT